MGDYAPLARYADEQIPADSSALAQKISDLNIFFNMNHLLIS